MIARDVPLLVADIGGTNARFALSVPRSCATGFILQDHQSYEAANFPTIYDAVATYLETLNEEKPHAACFAVAAPIVHNHIQLTNSRWSLDLEKAPALMALDELRVVNDFKAMTYGALFTNTASMVEVKPGWPDEKAIRAVMGPGTGLGLGLLLPQDGSFRAIATEGGHALFSPSSALDLKVQQILMRKFGVVTFEHILSGQGLLNIYQALCEIEGAPVMFKHPGEITQVTEKAAPDSQQDIIALQVLNLFCEALGIYARNIALTTGAFGGIYLSGGILPRIQEFFLNSRFAEIFTGGVMAHVTQDIPVWLMTSQEAALVGAVKLFQDEN